MDERRAVQTNAAMVGCVACCIGWAAIEREACSKGGNVDFVPHTLCVGVRKWVRGCYSVGCVIVDTA
jgi:hypothetical protein